MAKTKSVFVTGGTGFVGAYLLRQLLKQGYRDIRALKRATSKMDLVADIQEEIKWLEGDILDIVFLEQAMADVDQIYHCAAVVSFDPKEVEWMMKVNVEGTANLVNVALELDIDKFVFVSSIAAIGRTKLSREISEKNKWERSNYNSDYGISKYLAEQEVWRGAAEGLPVALVNPAVILGSGYWELGTMQLFLKVYNGLKFYPTGSTGFVDVRDVVKFMVLLMESEIVGERFILNGQNLSFKALFKSMAKAMNKKSPSFKVSKLIAATAWRGEWLRSKFTNHPPLLTRQTLRQSAQVYFYKNEKSLSVFDFEYTPIEDTIRETSEQLMLAAEQDMEAMVLPIL